MSFVNTGLLWALPLALVPIIIYYLMRFRSLKVTWGANYVLERALERLRKKLYLDQIILLALRVCACLAIVLAFARPTSSVKSSRVSSSGVHRVLIVDGSYSMTAGEGAENAWERVRDTLDRLVSTWGRGERWSLYFVGQSPGWTVRDAVVATPEKTRAVVDSLKPVECSADLGKALETVLAACAQDKRLEIYLAADDQALSWRSAEAVSVPAGRARLYWIRPKRDDRSNLAVLSVRPAHDRVLAGQPCRVFVQVRNFAPDAVQDAPVELLVDGAFSAREPISLLPGQDGGVHFDVTFDKPGSHAVTARLGKDALAFDNECSAGLDVVERLKVVVLRDPARQGKFDSAWGFLDLASKTMKRRDEDGYPIFTGAPFDVSLSAPASDWRAATPDVIVVDGGCTLTPELVRRLKDWVAAGGGLVLAPDDRVDLARWNDLLGRADLLPARLLRTHVEPLGGDRFASLARTGFGTPALRLFETNEDGDLTRLRFYSWVELGDPVKGAATMAPFADGRPFAVEARRPLGCVVLIGSGLNGRTNNLIVSELLYPFLVQLFSEAASGAVYPRVVALREPIRLRVPRPESLKGLTFGLAGAEPVPLTPRTEGAYAVAALPDGAPRSGLASILVIRPDASRRVWFGVQGARTDSDLTPLSRAQRRTLTARLGMAEASDWQQLDELLKARRRGGEWHTWVMIALLAFLLGEMLMQRRFV